MLHSLHLHISICGCRLVMDILWTKVSAEIVTVSFDVLMAVTMKILYLECSTV